MSASTGPRKYERLLTCRTVTPSHAEHQMREAAGAEAWP
jgi:hypothetical protein